VKANHVLQLATQLYVVGVHEGHLLYYHTDGRYKVYAVRCTPDAYESVVLPWLHEAIVQRAGRMPPGVAGERRLAVASAFLK
jgi:hypothetical protein